MRPPDPKNEPVEGAPEEVLAAARAAFGHRTHDAVATLEFDSLLDEGAPAADHLLRFEHPVIRIEVSISVTTASARLSGHIEPPDRVRVELHRAESDEVLAEDSTEGAFGFESARHGTIRLRILGAEAMPALSTEWFRV
jgi:hypothetical protein